MKKQLIIKFVKGIMLFVSTLLFTGCIQRTLDQLPLDMPVNISFDWTNLAAGSKVPSSMVLSFYNSNGVRFLEEKCTATGYTGLLPEGTYKVLAFNEDTQGVYRDSLEIYDKAKIVALATKAVSISQSTNVYGVGLGELKLSSSAAVASPMPKLAPKPLAKQVTLSIGVTGDKGAVSNCTTTLSGISRAINISTGALMPEEGTITFEPTSSASDKGFQSTVSFFGVVASTSSTTAPVKNEMVTVVTYTNGHKETLPLADLTKELTQALAPTGAGSTTPVDIKVEIAVTEAVLGGFTAKVTSWEIVNGELIVK